MYQEFFTWNCRFFIPKIYIIIMTKVYMQKGVNMYS